MDIIERDIYTLICRHDGIRAREIAAALGKDRTVINRYLYGSPYMRELCYKDSSYRWHGLIRQAVPHAGFLRLLWNGMGIFAGRERRMV